MDEPGVVGDRLPEGIEAALPRVQACQRRVKKHSPQTLELYRKIIREYAVSDLPAWKVGDKLCVSPGHVMNVMVGVYRELGWQGSGGKAAQKRQRLRREFKKS